MPSVAKKYTVTFPTREGYKNGYPVKAESHWYTDGSNTKEGVQAGLYRQQWLCYQ